MPLIDRGVHRCEDLLNPLIPNPSRASASRGLDGSRCNPHPALRWIHVEQGLLKPWTLPLPQEVSPSLARLGGISHVQTVLEDIATALWEHRNGLGVSLGSGLPGAALFLGHLSKRPGFESWRDRSRHMIELAVHALGPGTAPSLYGGYVGVAWAVEHLSQEVFGSDGEDANEEVDEFLLEMVSVEEWVRHFDLVSGLTGIGVYALERATKPSARAILERVLVHLDHLAVADRSFRSWPTQPRWLTPWALERSPRGHFDLGVAHGVPGILALLAGMHAAGIGDGLAMDLYLQGSAWLRSVVQDPDCGSYLGGWIPRDGEAASTRGVRVAWCYGDLGASVALLWAARLVGRPQDEAWALALGRLAAERAVDESGVLDVSLCHGSAGNAHLFRRLFMATGVECFERAAGAYLVDALQRRQPGRGFAGFFHYAPDRYENEWDMLPEHANKPSPGLLEGAAGVGLALLAAMGGAEPTWDHFMLASAPNLGVLKP